MRTLTTKEWDLLKEAMELVTPKNSLKDFEKQKLKNARRLLNNSNDKQNPIS